MDSPSGNGSQLGIMGQRLASRLMAVAENRIELFMVEMQEQRDHLLKGILLALGAAVFGLLAGIGLSAAIVFCFWNSSPLAALRVLSGLHACAAAGLYAKFNKVLAEWEALPATLEQFKKDRQCLEENLR